MPIRKLNVYIIIMMLLLGIVYDYSIQANIFISLDKRLHIVLAEH